MLHSTDFEVQLLTPLGKWRMLLMDSADIVHQGSVAWYWLCSIFTEANEKVKQVCQLLQTPPKK